MRSSARPWAAPSASQAAPGGWWARRSSTGVGDDEGVGGAGGSGTDSVGVGGGRRRRGGRGGGGLRGRRRKVLHPVGDRGAEVRRFATTTVPGSTTGSAHARNGAGGASRAAAVILQTAPAWIWSLSTRGAAPARSLQVLSAGVTSSVAQGALEVALEEPARLDDVVRVHQLDVEAQRGEVHRVRTAQPSCVVGEERVGVQLAARLCAPGRRPRGSGRWCRGPRAWWCSGRSGPAASRAAGRGRRCSPWSRSVRSTGGEWPGS